MTLLHITFNKHLHLVAAQHTKWAYSSNYHYDGVYQCPLSLLQMTHIQHSPCRIMFWLI